MIDQHITDDLAIVARTSQARPIALETTLARLSPTAQPSTGFAATYVYAMRVGRISGGVTAFVAIVALLLAMQLVPFAGNGDTMLEHLAWMAKSWVALCVMGVVLVAHTVGAWLAVPRRVEARRGRNASIAASVAGLMAFCLFFGMAQVVVGGDGLSELTYKIPWAKAADVMLGAALLVTMIAALVITITGISSRWWMLPAGLALLTATITTGVLFDAGPGTRFHPDYHPSTALRAVLTATGTVALFLIITSLVLRVHARDERHASRD